MDNSKLSIATPMFAIRLKRMASFHHFEKIRFANWLRIVQGCNLVLHQTKQEKIATMGCVDWLPVSQSKICYAVSAESENDAGCSYDVYLKYNPPLRSLSSTMTLDIITRFG